MYHFLQDTRRWQEHIQVVVTEDLNLKPYKIKLDIYEYEKINFSSLEKGCYLLNLHSLPLERFVMTGIIIVVNGMLSMNAEQIPETHTINTIATVNL